MQALRNIKYTLRKYFVPMLMSLIGLILAFSAFMLISVQLDFEKGFDRFHPDAGNIYRVDLSDNNTIFRSILPPGFSDEVIRSSSHIVAGTVVCPFLGEDTRTIRMEIIQETVLLSLIAFAGAVIAVVFLSPAVTEMGIVNTVFSFEKNSSIVIITLLLALSGGILSGIYLPWKRRQ